MEVGALGEKGSIAVEIFPHQIAERRRNVAVGHQAALKRPRRRAATLGQTMVRSPRGGRRPRQRYRRRLPSQGGTRRWQRRFRRLAAHWRWEDFRARRPSGGPLHQEIAGGCGQACRPCPVASAAASLPEASTPGSGIALVAAIAAQPRLRRRVLPVGVCGWRDACHPAGSARAAAGCLNRDAVANLRPSGLANHWPESWRVRRPTRKR